MELHLIFSKSIVEALVKVFQHRHKMGKAHSVLKSTQSQGNDDIECDSGQHTQPNCTGLLYGTQYYQYANIQWKAKAPQIIKDNKE
jgi:hypothetical protein